MSTKVVTRTFTNSAKKKGKPKPKSRKTTTKQVVIVPRNQRVLQNRIRNRLRRKTRPQKGIMYSSTQGKPKPVVRRNNVSQAGLDFLKCAFAPPDFVSTGVQGIPDGFRGKILLNKHRYTNASEVAPGNDYYYLLAPIPGVAFCYATVTAGTIPTATTEFVAVPYPDAAGLFGSTENTVAMIVNKYRLLSNHLEIVSLANNMTWNGSIQSYKFPVELVSRVGSAYTDPWTLTGLNAIRALGSDNFTTAYNKGVYVAAYNNAPTFPFKPILTTVVDGVIPNVIGTGDFAQINCSPLGSFPGFYDEFECVLIKIAGVTAAESFTMRCWQCVEYQVNPESNYYHFTTYSPQEDELAIKIYKEVILGLPIAVEAGQNANFWRRVLQIIQSISGVAAVIPGPYGTVARGVNLLSTGIDQLTM